VAGSLAAPVANDPKAPEGTLLPNHPTAAGVVQDGAAPSATADRPPAADELVVASAEERALRDRLLSGDCSQNDALKLYHLVVGRGATFPLAWEARILHLVLASAPNRADIRARLSEIDVDPSAGPMPTDAAVVDGLVVASAAEAHLRDQVLVGKASLADCGRLYDLVTARGGAFPPAWEARTLHMLLATHPERDDMRRRLLLVERMGPNAPIDRVTMQGALDRLGQAVLINHTDSGARERQHDRALGDAAAILSSPEFNSLSVGERVEAFRVVTDTLMSDPSPDWFPVIELGMRQFCNLLTVPELTEAQACRIYDGLHGLSFSAATDVADLRRFDALCAPAFETWLEKHVTRRPPRTLHTDGALTIAYFLHTAHFDRGNAVSPLIASLARAHATRPDRRILLYAVQWLGPKFAEQFDAHGVTVRTFPQDFRYDCLEAIADALAADAVDAVVTDQNRSIAAALFVRRVAPLQLWVDTGFPFWRLRALDWTLLPSKDATSTIGIDSERCSPLQWRRHSFDERTPADPAKVAEARDHFPPGRCVLGVFARLAKLSDAFLDLMANALARDPAYHLLIVGNGDPGAVVRFMARPGLAERVTFINEMVDLGVYGAAIDIMCDTFPFVGGNACRDVAACGTPVVSMLGTAWDRVLHEDRNADLLARSPSTYLDILDRLRVDPTFRAHQREITLKRMTSLDSTTEMIDDVESGIRMAAR
jgi:glycosyltransferase involved in cell wall biosynthesis